MQQSKPKLLDGRQQRRNLQMVAADLARSEHGNSLFDGFIDRADDELCPKFRARGGREIRSIPGKWCPVSMLRSGIGRSEGRNAFSARRSRQIESLPPEKSSAGRSNSAATSRITWMASVSRYWR